MSMRKILPLLFLHLWACSPSEDGTNLKVIEPITAPQTPFRWDNGAATAMVRVKSKPKTTSRFDLRWSLEAPRLQDPESRHKNTKIALFGRSPDAPDMKWTKLGDLVDKPTLPQGPWSGMLKTCPGTCEFEKGFLGSPSKVVGKINFDQLDFQDRLVMFYTMADFSKAPSAVEDIPQSIVMGFLDESNQFHQYETPVLDPTDQRALDLGYSVKPSDKVVQAWRDPFVFTDQDGTYHMVFGARYSEDSEISKLIGFDPERNSAVGHAVFNGESFVLQKPFPISHTAAQFELPHVLKYKGNYYIIILEADWQFNPDGTRTERIHRLRMFKTKSLDAPAQQWQNWGKVMANGERSSELIRLNGDGMNLYGITFYQEGEQFKIMGFDSNQLDLTKQIVFDNQVLEDEAFSQKLDTNLKYIGIDIVDSCGF